MPARSETSHPPPARRTRCSSMCRHAAAALRHPLRRVPRRKQQAVRLVVGRKAVAVSRWYLQTAQRPAEPERARADAGAVLQREAAALGAVAGRRARSGSHSLPVPLFRLVVESLPMPPMVPPADGSRMPDVQVPPLSIDPPVDRPDDYQFQALKVSVRRRRGRPDRDRRPSPHPEKPDSASGHPVGRILHRPGRGQLEGGRCPAPGKFPGPERALSVITAVMSSNRGQVVGKGM